MIKKSKVLFTPQFGEMPNSLPIFPLDNQLLLPQGKLPLNIFEPRYLAMVEDCLGTRQRMIGIVQLARASNTAVNAVGCAGKIVYFAEQDDSRIMIILQGKCRFRIKHELDQVRGYRVVEPIWSEFSNDLFPPDSETLLIDRDKLQHHLKSYLDSKSLTANWEAIGKTPDIELITSLAMLCPFSAAEKQSLLETSSTNQLAEKLMVLLEISSHGQKIVPTTQH